MTAGVSQPDRIITLVVCDTPPSLNATRYMHWRKAAKLTKTWISTFEVLLLAEGMVPCRRVRARAELTFKTAQRRDQVNFRTPIEKALGDALTGSRHTYPEFDAKKGKVVKRAAWPDGHWLRDDTPDYFRFGTVTFLKGPAPETRVILACWD